MSKHECNIDFKIEGMDNDTIKGKIRIKGNGCGNLTQEQLLKKLNENRR